MAKQHIDSIADMKKVAIANLGTMDKGDYKFFMAKAREVAEKQGIKNPILVIDVKFKPGVASNFGVTETPYPIIADGWELCVSQGRTMTEHMPEVHVVDGDKYAFPI